MFLGFLVDFTIVNTQSQGSPSSFSNQEAGTAMMGVVPLLIFFHKASIYAFLDLALDFLNLFLRSGIGTMSHSHLLNFKFQFQVHVDQVFAGRGRRQGTEHLFIGQGQFLQSGVNVQTLDFLPEVLLSMEVALTTLIHFLPISSFSRYRAIIPLRGMLLPIVQRIH